MTSQSERRTFLRTAQTDMWIDINICHSTTLLAEAPAKSMHVKVDNLSESGLCLLSSEPFELGHIIQFNSPELPATGVVVWTSQSKGESKAGIQFR